MLLLKESNLLYESLKTQKPLFFTQRFNEGDKKELNHEQLKVSIKTAELTISSLKDKISNLLESRFFGSF